MSPLAGDSGTAEAARDRSPSGSSATLVCFTPTKTLNAIQNLQNCETPHSHVAFQRSGHEAPRSFSPRVPSYDGGPLAGGGHRRKRHQRMAGPRQPRHHSPVCRDQFAHKTSRRCCLLASGRKFRSMPPKQRMAQGPGSDELASVALTIMCPSPRAPP